MELERMHGMDVMTTIKITYRVAAHCLRALSLGIFGMGLVVIDSGYADMSMTASTDDRVLLAHYMEGSFRDDQGYLRTGLQSNACIIEAGDNGVKVYFERGNFGKLYIQRVYDIQIGEPSGLSIEVLRFPEAERFAGLCQKLTEDDRRELLGRLTPFECRLHLEKKVAEGGKVVFQGSTAPGGCASRFGAISSEVEFGEGYYQSHDQVAGHSLGHFRFTLTGMDVLPFE